MTLEIHTVDWDRHTYMTGVKPVNVSIIGIPTGKSIGFWFEKKLP